MTRAWWRRVRPWLVPLLVVTHVVLVVTGRLRPGTAVAVVIGVEVLLAVAAGSGTVSALRSFRTGRSADRDPWIAAEDALTHLVPRRLARVLLFEVRLMTALVSWLTRRHADVADHTFSYHRGLAVLIWAGFVLIAVEGAVVELVLAIALPRTVWPWIALAAHGYGLLWLAGLYASMVTRPHLLGDRAVRMRDGIFTEVVIPYPALLAARASTQPNFGRSGLKIDRVDQSALLASGDANIMLSLDPHAQVEINGARCETPLSSLSITADAPKDFIRALNAARTGQAS